MSDTGDQLTEIREKLAQLEGQFTEHMGEEMHQTGAVLEELKVHGSKFAAVLEELNAYKIKFDRMTGVLVTHNDHYAKNTKTAERQTRLIRILIRRMRVLDLLGQAIQAGKDLDPLEDDEDD